MDLEKEYDKVYREKLWRVLHEYGVDGYLNRSISSLNNGSKTCVRVGSRVGEYFVVRGVETGECDISVAFQCFP